MEAGLDLRVAELLCSRLCHDIVSPVGAVNSGLELMAEFGDDGGDDALDLVRTSAGEAAAKLQFFRVAYGLAGAQAGGPDLAEAARLAAGMITSKRISLDWPVEQQPPVAAAPRGTKLLLNLIATAVDALPRGGVVRVTVAEGPDALETQVLAVAEDARLTDEAAAALKHATDIADLGPRDIQAWFTRFLADRLNTALTVTPQPGAGIGFAVALPRA